MRRRFEPRLDILPDAQKTLWPLLEPARGLEFVLYGGTAVALHLGHRSSIDFDFFRSQRLAKGDVEQAFAFMHDAQTLQESENTLVVAAQTSHGSVKISYFGGMGIGRIDNPLETQDSVLLVASLEDLLATKLKAILDRAEAKDYSDIAAMLDSGVSLERGLGGFAKMYRRDPALPLKALGFFKDGDLPSLPQREQDLLRDARDRVKAIPEVAISSGSLAGN
jgi:hypothetical protein